MNVSRVRLLTCVVLPLLTACGTEPAGSVPAPAVTYTCCPAEDVDKLYRPGQTLTAHWAVESAEQPGGTPPQVELTAHLTGPFATVADVKAAAEGVPAVAGLVTFTAAPVRPSGRADERPVSTIVIGPDAKPGYYNLVTAVGDGDNAASGGESIVRVVPSP
ncbi:hypothetical protein AB0H57_23380 [Micromonospora sp. NPDC050686]|uniref:hypothetical protein n=1 Tax=Micromonospora sp. NPDC050686 TaxID=3154631 RepID=UPI0033FDFF95